MRYQGTVTYDEEAILALCRILGWRYAVKALTEQLFLPKAVHIYRGAPYIGCYFSRLKNRPLRLRPFYTQREGHVVRLVHLLSLALCLLNHTEMERLLGEFKEIKLIIVQLPGQIIYHIPPLTKLQ